MNYYCDDLLTDCHRFRLPFSSSECWFSVESTDQIFIPPSRPNAFQWNSNYIITWYLPSTAEEYPRIFNCHVTKQNTFENNSLQNNMSSWIQTSSSWWLYGAASMRRFSGKKVLLFVYFLVRFLWITKIENLSFGGLVHNLCQQGNEHKQLCDYIV